MRQLDLWVSSDISPEDRATLVAGLRTLASVRLEEHRAPDPEMLRYIVAGVELLTAGASLAAALIEWRRSLRSRGQNPVVRMQQVERSIDISTETEEEIRAWLSE